MTQIYTKTGDKGQTRLVGGCLVSKTDPRVDAYGTVDELNSQLGLVQFNLKKNLHLETNPLEGLNLLSEEIHQIQNILFNVGSLLACEDEALSQKLPQVTENQILALEKAIDRMSTKLPPLKNFILPDGSELACWFHLARTTCRRAERNSAKHLETWNEICFRYLNRLSDYFFVAARYSNFLSGLEDKIWEKP
jgi:cob(I)alamin adenosyltransferase